MNGFFSGWRKKVGVMTLLVACVFLAGWVKSIVAIDIAVIPLGAHSAVTVFSEDQLFGVQYQFERLGLHRTTRFSWASHATAHHTFKEPFPGCQTGVALPCLGIWLCRISGKSSERQPTHILADPLLVHRYSFDSSFRLPSPQKAKNIEPEENQRTCCQRGDLNDG